MDMEEQKEKEGLGDRRVYSDPAIANTERSTNAETITPRRDDLEGKLPPKTGRPFLRPGTQKRVLPATCDTARGLSQRLGEGLCKPPNGSTRTTLPTSRAEAGQGRGRRARQSKERRTWVEAKGTSITSRPSVSSLRSAPSRPPGRWEQAVQTVAEAEAVAQTEVMPKRTTVMMEGFPSSYSRSMLMNLLHVFGYTNEVDFVHCPINFETAECVGNAFVNLVEPAIAERFKDFFNHFCDYPFSPSQTCRTHWARIQGLDANVKMNRNSPIMCEEVPDIYKPVLLSNGLRFAFPEPTKKVKDFHSRRRMPEAMFKKSVEASREPEVPDESGRSDRDYQDFPAADSD